MLQDLFTIQNCGGETVINRQAAQPIESAEERDRVLDDIIKVFASYLRKMHTTSGEAIKLMNALFHLDRVGPYELHTFTAWLKPQTGLITAPSKTPILQDVIMGYLANDTKKIFREETGFQDLSSFNEILTTKTDLLILYGYKIQVPSAFFTVPGRCWLRTAGENGKSLDELSSFLVNISIFLGYTHLIKSLDYSQRDGLAACALTNLIYRQVIEETCKIYPIKPNKSITAALYAQAVKALVVGEYIAKEVRSSYTQLSR